MPGRGRVGVGLAGVRGRERASARPRRRDPERRERAVPVRGEAPIRAGTAGSRISEGRSPRSPAPIRPHSPSTPQPHTPRGSRPQRSGTKGTPRLSRASTNPRRPRLLRHRPLSRITNPRARHLPGRTLAPTPPPCAFLRSDSRARALEPQRAEASALPREATPPAGLALATLPTASWELPVPPPTGPAPPWGPKHLARARSFGLLCLRGLPLPPRRGPCLVPWSPARAGRWLLGVTVTASSVFADWRVCVRHMRPGGRGRHRGYSVHLGEAA